MTDDGVPAVVFLCVDDAGRSAMAAGFFDQIAAGRATSSTGRSRHSAAVSAAAVSVMAEVGIAIPAPKAQRATKDLVNAADVVVTMGPGTSCSGYNDAFEDWQLDDPDAVTVAALRPIRDEIERRVRTLLTSLDGRRR